jgi:hypothetical protein
MLGSKLIGETRGIRKIGKQKSPDLALVASILQKDEGEQRANAGLTVTNVRHSTH